MNIKVSYNWLCEYLPGLKASPEEVARNLSLHAFSVERLHRMDELLDHVMVGRVKEISSHPNADKLRIATVDVGSFGTSVPIVCGGVNLSEGMLVAVALPGAKVRWHGEGEPVELKTTEIRGARSEGMICAASEIGLFEAFPHKEREILDLSFTGAKPGTPVRKALRLDDVVLEVEITTNRPDAMGMMGIAREVGAIFGVPLKQPKAKNLNLKSKSTLEVRVEAPKQCLRYMALVLDGITIAPSPWWMQQRLVASGMHPINNIVDITNYVLLEYGQPCHAFDFDQIKSEIPNPKSQIPKIVVRMARKGEKIIALDGASYDLDENILVIADAKKPIAIAGVMGGQQSGIGPTTTSIVYEVATFDGVTVRKAEHQLGLSSESSTRFNKGLPMELPSEAAARLVELTGEIAGGKLVSIVDKNHAKSRPTVISVSPSAVTDIIGVSVKPAVMKKDLAKLGFKIAESASQWKITFPYWRTIEADGVADIAEEVARMYGYHRLPSILPKSVPSADPPSNIFSLEHGVKEIMRGAGYTEAYTYSFVSGDEVTRAGGDLDDAVALLNPLSSELTHLRPWLGISMLKAIQKNQESGRVLHLFELSDEYYGAGKGKLPEERQKLIACVSGKDENERLFYEVKGIAEHLASLLGLPLVTFEKFATKTKESWVASRYHPSRVVVTRAGGDILGVVGEIHPRLIRAFGIEDRVAFLEWDFQTLAPLMGKGRAYRPPSLYPPVKRDISFMVSKGIEYQRLFIAMQNVDPLLSSVEFFDSYEGKGVPAGCRSLAFHIRYASEVRTLTAPEADAAHAKLTVMLKKEFNATVRD